jgi:membrane protease YdiL (CAAX protease family)
MSEIKDKNKVSKKPIIMFFLLTYLITWTAWIISIIVLNINGDPIPSHLNFFDRLENGYNSGLHRIMTYLFTIGTIGPMISAIIVIKIYYGNEELKKFFKSFIKFKVEFKWYIIIIAIPFVLSMLSIMFNLISGGDISGVFAIESSFIAYTLLFINQVFTSGLEEPGWRGFATPEMQKFKNAEDSGFYIGIFWGIWHFPFLIYLYTTVMEMEVFLIVLTLVGYVALIIPMSIVNVWIFNNTKSTGILILAHTFNNFINFIIIGNMVDSSGGFLIAVLTWLFAAFLTKKYGKKDLIKLSDEEKEERMEKKKKKEIKSK